MLIEADATDPAATGAALASVRELAAVVARRDLTGPLAPLAATPAPFEVRVHKRYNPEGITAYNVVPGLIGVILTMTLVLMTAMMVVVFFAGMVLDFIPIVLIFTPVFMPIVKAADIDPVYFGVVFIMNCSIGLITPPVGVVLNVVSAIGKVSFAQAARGVLPATYDRADGVFNSRRLAMLMHGLLTGDAGSLRLGMEDRVHQPYRKALIGPVDAAIDGAISAEPAALRWASTACTPCACSSASARQ